MPRNLNIHIMLLVKQIHLNKFTGHVHVKVISHDEIWCCINSVSVYMVYYVQ